MNNADKTLLMIIATFLGAMAITCTGAFSSGYTQGQEAICRNDCDIHFYIKEDRCHCLHETAD